MRYPNDLTILERDHIRATGRDATKALTSLVAVYPVSGLDLFVADDDHIRLAMRDASNAIMSLLADTDALERERDHLRAVVADLS